MKTELADQLLLLALVERHGTLAAAGDVLGLTPPAVSQRLARAEAYWQVKLVERGPRGATLTEPGRALAAHGHRVEREVADALASFPAYRQGLLQRLRVGAFQAAALYLVPPAMTALRHRVADVDLSVINIQSGDGVGLVTRGELDLAVIAAWDAKPSAPAGFALSTIVKDPLVVVCAGDHRLAGSTRPLDLSSLAAESWVVIRGGSAARAQFDRVTAEAGFEPRIRFETESYDVAQALVATGYGVALVSRMALRGDLGLVHRPLHHRPAHRTIHVVRPQEASALTCEFERLLRDVGRDLS